MAKTLYPVKHLLCTLPVLLILAFWLPASASAKLEKPTLTVEDFFRFIRGKHYEEAADLLSRSDQNNFKTMVVKLKASGQNEAAASYSLGGLIKDQFFLMHGRDNAKMAKKSGDGEVILPDKVGFFVPGQYYIVGNYAVVFTRETYDLPEEKTGPVRDDPRKLWVDPTNDLSKIRDEAYFKQWWVWENNYLTMPGVIWLVKERREWRIDLFSGAVPKSAFRGVLKWHFGRDIFEDMSASKKPNQTKSQPAKPSSSNP